MTKANTVEEHHILKNSLEDIMADRFARYSKYIIQERALPDARDGLKPVQRRILYAMYEDGNTYNKPYRKSAKRSVMSSVTIIRMEIVRFMMRWCDYRNPGNCRSFDRYAGK